MAKNQPETVDRFRIFAETTSEAMGPLLAQLTKMGLENIGYELITDVVSYNKRAKHETSLRDVAMAFLEDNPTFKASTLAHHLRELGRGHSSAHSIIRDLVADGTLRKLGGGNYSRADVKAIGSNTKVSGTKTSDVGEKPSLRGKHHKAPQEITNLEFIWNKIKGRKRITSLELRDFFNQEKRNPKSISPILSKMVVTKMLRSTGVGEYEVLSSNKAKTKEPTLKSKARKPKLGKKPSLAAAKEARNKIDRERYAAARQKEKQQQATTTDSPTIIEHKNNGSGETSHGS